MKNGKRVYLIALFLAFAVGTVSAQQQGGPGPQGQGSQGLETPNMRLIEELALDEFQAAEVQAIFDAAATLHEEQRAICYDANMVVRDVTHEAVLAVLTIDQQIRFEELSALRDENLGGGNRGNNGQRGKPADRPNGDCTNPDCTSEDCTNPDCPNDGSTGTGG